MAVRSVCEIVKAKIEDRKEIVKNELTQFMDEKETLKRRCLITAYTRAQKLLEEIAVESEEKLR